MGNLALRWLADGASALLLLVGAVAFTLIGMWPVDDSVALRMADNAWLAEALRRFLFLAAWACGGGLLALLGHIALYRLASVGSMERASKWAVFSAAALLLVAAAATGRFLAVRPWF
nr:hypothetical protein [uncultured Albidiferax sp.]